MVINGKQAMRMSQKGKITLEFQNYSKQMPVPFVIYADFEAITEKYKVAKLIMQNHILINIKSILSAAMDTKWFAAIMTNIQNR